MHSNQKSAHRKLEIEREMHKIEASLPRGIEHHTLTWNTIRLLQKKLGDLAEEYADLKD